MKNIIVILGAVLSLFATQCRADFLAPAGQKVQLGVIVAMEKVNVAGTPAAEEYVTHGSNFGTQIGSNFGLLGGLIGMVAGAVGDKVVHASKSEVDGYKVTIRFDDGSELIREKRADRLDGSKFGVGSRVRVEYTPKKMEVFSSDVPLPANVPAAETAEMSKVDAPEDGINVSVVNKQ